MAVYRDGIKCFGCGKSIPRTMEALAYLLFNDERRWRDALRVANRYVGREEDYREKRELAAKPLSHERAEAFATHLWTARRARVEWLMGRCLEENTIRRAMIGHTGLRFTIPIFEKDGQLLTFRFRRDDAYCRSEWECARPTPKYTGLPGRNGIFLYPEWLIAEHQPTTLYVWEGEFDTLLSWQRGMEAVTITNGAGNFKKLPGLIRERFPSVRQLLIGGDMDEPGKQARKECDDAARDIGFKTHLLRWEPEKGKDLTELIQHGWTQQFGKEAL